MSDVLNILWIIFLGLGILVELIWLLGRFRSA
jgi:hypothetical protein